MISYRSPQSRAIIEAVLVKRQKRFWRSYVALKPHVQFHSSKKAHCDQQRALISAKMVLSMPTPSLKEFAQTIPVCQLASGLATVLELFCTSGCEAIVVVSDKLRPLGIINLRQVLPYLISNPSKNTPSARLGEGLAQPISGLNPSIIQPLSTLPAQLHLSQFWAYIQQTKNWKLGENSLSQFSTDQHWALVDEQEQFLGLLDNCQLLNFFASKFTANNQTETPQRQKLAPLLQLLEQLPIPLSLQTVSGEILAQNPAWQTQVAPSPDSNRNHHLSNSFLNSPIFGSSSNRNLSSTTEVSPLNDSATELQLATRHRYQETDPAAACKPSQLPSTPLNNPPVRQKPPAVIQRYCALDTPHMAAEVSQRRVMLSLINAIENPELETAVETALPTKENRKNQSFSLIKIPLSPSLLQLEGTWQHHLSESLNQTTTPELLLVIAQDITEHQQVTKELAAKNADLVQLNRLKDEFLACISHELKTPLTAVLGLSSLLKDQTLGPLNERQSRYAQLIYHSGRQLMTVVNDILDLTRMETGQLELTLEPVQIQSVCDRAYSQAHQRPTEKNQQDQDTTDDINFTLSIEPGLEFLVADELRLRQMLMHLLSNALKFTEPTGEIGLQVSRWEGWIAFTVWDTGIGIPAEKQHLIFQKFQQLEQPLTRRHEGTGLGLVLTQRLARLHGGDISFISKVGVGSQFTLLLPPTPPQETPVAEETPSPTASKPAKSHAKASKSNRLVLLVETVPQYLEDLTQQLNNLAYRVVIARSGTEAIEKARSLQPCAVLLNPLLPQLSGWDVLTLLKSDAQTCHIPAIVTATQAEKKQAYHNKADGFLSLPVQEQALLQSLTSLGEHSLAPKKRSLTIMHLSPVLDETVSQSSVLSCELTAILNDQNSELNYRILEADDLEQAALLTRVWHPDVLLLDSGKVPDPLAYVAEFSSYPDLTALPLVTLDHQTTEAANQVADLTVYPCLATDNACKVEALLEVLQVAAGMNRKPSILVMDIKSSQNLVAGATPTSGTCWRQALIQYLETAGFRSILSLSWAEVHRQLQDQTVDLVLLRLKDDCQTEVLLDELGSLAKLPLRPPLFVLDQRLQEVKNSKDKLNSKLESLLSKVATQVLPGSVSMSQLLHSINQILAET